MGFKFAAKNKPMEKRWCDASHSNKISTKWFECEYDDDDDDDDDGVNGDNVERPSHIRSIETLLLSPSPVPPSPCDVNVKLDLMVVGFCRSLTLLTLSLPPSLFLSRRVGARRLSFVRLCACAAALPKKGATKIALFVFDIRASGGAFRYDGRMPIGTPVRRRVKSERTPGMHCAVA